MRIRDRQREVETDSPRTSGEAVDSCAGCLIQSKICDPTLIKSGDEIFGFAADLHHRPRLKEGSRSNAARE